MLPASVAMQLRPASPGLWQLLWTCAGDSLAGLLGISHPSPASLDPATLSGPSVGAGGFLGHPDASSGFPFTLSPFFAGGLNSNFAGGLGQGYPPVPVAPPALLALRSRLQALAAAPVQAHAAPWATCQASFPSGNANSRGQDRGMQGKNGSAAADMDLLSGPASAPVAAILASIHFLGWAARMAGSASGLNSSTGEAQMLNWGAELDAGDGEAILETWVCQCLDVLAALLKHTPGMLAVLIGAPGPNTNGWPRRQLQFQNQQQQQGARLQGSAPGAALEGAGLLRPLLASLRSVAAAQVDSLPVLSGATAVLRAAAEQLPALTLRHHVGEVLGWTLPARAQPGPGPGGGAGSSGVGANAGAKDEKCGKVLFLETQLSNGIYPQRCQAVALLHCLMKSPVVGAYADLPLWLQCTGVLVSESVA
jgi:hypothetical protein